MKIDNSDRTHSIAKDEKGAVAIVFAIILMPIFVLIMGSAIDFGVASLIQNRLHSAADAAVISVARSSGALPEGQLQAELENSFRTNFPDGYMGVRNVSVRLTNIRHEAGISEFDVAVSGEYPTLIMH